MMTEAITTQDRELKSNGGVIAFPGAENRGKNQTHNEDNCPDFLWSEYRDYKSFSCHVASK